MKELWETNDVSFAWLKKQAYDYDHMTSAFGWLKRLGLVPDSVQSRKVVLVKLDLDPARINVGYLASCAYEWDTWGLSSPVDFVKAIECELAGKPQRDIVAGILIALGQETYSMEAAA